MCDVANIFLYFDVSMASLAQPEGALTEKTVKTIILSNSLAGDRGVDRVWCRKLWVLSATLERRKQDDNHDGCEEREQRGEENGEAV